MGLFKNDVGRPSNETLRNRKIFYAIAGVSVTCLVVLGVFFLTRGTNDISGRGKNAAVGCAQPYTVAACKTASSTDHGATIKKLQEMLKDAGYYTGAINGNYTDATATAVKKAQAKYGLAQNGNADSALVTKMADSYGYGFTTILYNSNGGTGQIYGTDSNKKQFVMRANVPVSSSSLTKSGNTHIGYTATAKNRWTTTNYYYGCNSKKCTKPTMYTEAQKKSLGSSFTPYVFLKGESVNSDIFNYIAGVHVTFNAFYCSSSGATYNKSTSSCSKGAPVTTVEVSKPVITYASCSGQNLVISAYQTNGKITNITVNGLSKSFNQPSISNGSYNFNLQNNKTYTVTVYGNNNLKASQSITCTTAQKPVITDAKCNGQNLVISAYQTNGKITNITINGMSKTLNQPSISNGSYNFNLAAGKTYTATVYGQGNLTASRSVTCPSYQKPVITSAKCSGQNLVISAYQTNGKITNITINGMSKSFNQPSISNGSYNFNLAAGKTYTATVYGQGNLTASKSVTCSYPNPVITSAKCSGQNLVISAYQTGGKITNITINGMSKTLNQPSISNGSYNFNLAAGKTYTATVYGLGSVTASKSVTCPDTTKPTISISANGSQKIRVVASDNVGLSKLVLDCNTPNAVQTKKSISGKSYSGDLSDYRMKTGNHFVCVYDTAGNMTKSNTVYVKGL